MLSTKPKLGKLALLVLAAAITLTACNSKKKSDSEVKTDTTKTVVDTLKDKPTAPADRTAAPVDTVVNKPTAPAD